MAYFPMFIDLRGKECLVVGGGEVALRKIEQLVKFAPSLCVIAPAIHPEIEELAQTYPIHIEKRPYKSDDLNDRFLVIGALDDLSEQEKIFNFCMDHHIHVNCVDSPAWCSFIFPALIVKDDLCVGINTAGRAPAVSSALRQYLTKMIPSKITELIDRVDHIRQREPVGKPRQAKIIAICKAFFEQ